MTYPFSVPDELKIGDTVELGDALANGLMQFIGTLGVIEGIDKDLIYKVRTCDGDYWFFTEEDFKRKSK